MKAKSWFIGTAAPSRRLRLYCFSHAGGSAAGYLPWQGKLGDDVEVCALQLPGRGGRFGEPGYTAMGPLAADVADQIGRHADGPFAFFGHSMGALLAFETARNLQASGGQQPLLLVASGCEAPRYRGPSRNLHALDDAQLTAALGEYNGTPPEVLANKEIMALLLPMIRADFSVVETYSYAPGAALKVPLLAFAGRRDDPSRTAHVARWGDETTGRFGLHWFDGDHFFPQGAQHEVLRRLRAELSGLASSN